MAARSQAISIEELLALNDELRSLARAGVPLERGLRALGGDLPGKLGRLADAISQRMERGESLAGVLQDPSLGLPPVFCAVVAAGVRSGRLSAALESLSRSVQRATDLRRTMIVGFVYPVIVLLIATAVFVFTWWKLFPVMSRAIPSMIEQQTPNWFQWLAWTVEQGGIWLMVGWMLMVFLGGIWFVRSQSAARFGTGWSRWPSVGAVNAAGRTATFAEMLALLIEHQVPLVEALSLAAASSGDRKIRIAADMIAERIRAGSQGGPAPRGLPPLLSWLILTNAPTAQLVKTLRQTAAGLRERAHRLSIFLGIYLPIVLSAAVGSVVVVYYATLVMAPFYYLLLQLAQP